VAPPAVERLVERVAGFSALDSIARPLSKKVAALVPHGAMKDTLSGTWLGHPLHPMLTDVPIGSWTSAMALDLVAGKRGRAAAKTLVGLGVVSALPTAAAGLADWSDYLGEERRIGFVHAVGNVLAVGCYTLSWLARRRGDHRRGVALGFTGGAVATMSAYLGGHLAWRRGVNVDRHAWEEAFDEWVDVAAEDELEEGKPISVSAEGQAILLLRDGGAVRAIADVCGHAGGPLHEGTVEAGCVTCPWHGSVFRLEDGSVVHGPATAPQPSYDVRAAAGRVSVRSR
jgi:nitrite reductase/ring-hydroxylating ferredoxin subunit/uncharacterized membrane protein